MPRHLGSEEKHRHATCFKKKQKKQNMCEQNKIYMFNKNPKSLMMMLLSGQPVPSCCRDGLCCNAASDTEEGRTSWLAGGSLENCLGVSSTAQVNQRPRSSLGSVGHASSILSASDRDVRSLSSGRSLPSSSLQSCFFFLSFLRAHRHSCARLWCGFVSG